MTVIPFRPQPKTRTRRRKAAGDARRQLAAYTNLLGYDAKDGLDDDARRQEVRVVRLLWAKAYVDRALALETRGHLGNHQAIPATYLAEAATQARTEARHG